MHNGRLADPIDPVSINLSKLTSKKKKTYDDHMAIAKAEWYGGLYVDDKERPCLPGEVLESTLVTGAKVHRLGQVAKGGIIIFGNFKLVHDGPKTIDELWKHGGYIKRSAVRVKNARVIRTRPMFPVWSCKFTVQWDPQLVHDEEQLMDIVRSAGTTGLCDYRPKFGRFEVVE